MSNVILTVKFLCGTSATVMENKTITLMRYVYLYMICK